MSQVYSIVAKNLIDLMEKGTAPWAMPWIKNRSFPANMLSKKPYRGVNIMALGARGYTCPLWGTFKQISEKGGKINKGEHGTPIVYFGSYNREIEGEDRRFLVARFYKVWNIQQTDIEWAAEITNNENDSIESAESIVSNWENKPEIKHGYNHAAYAPILDVVQMPTIEAFSNSESYYATLFHELTHSTGHASRLNREGLSSPTFGSDTYAFEELIAEFGAAFLCANAGIDNSGLQHNSAAYLKGWSNKLRESPKMLIQAASKAQIAADSIMGMQPAEMVQ